MSSKKLPIRKYCYEKSLNHIQDVIYRTHLRKGILNLQIVCINEQSEVVHAEIFQFLKHRGVKVSLMNL